jgi:aspartyl-tRNA(Asn)/glutamyl-tRNA(Gln) amidotransferase subunit C
MTEKIDVRYVARLARIKLSEEEAGLFTRQLGDILAYVNKLNAELDKRSKMQKETPPMRYVHAAENPHRQDEVRKSISSESALKNAPQKKGDFFKVPKIIED